MNPDPNQPLDQPQTPTENPVPEVPQTPETPAPETPEATPSAFGGAPVASEPVAAPVSTPPTTTIGSSPNNDPTPNLVGNGKKKKLIILISVIVGVVVVLGIAAFIVMGLLFPSKADYRDAATQFNAVSSAYSDLNSDASKLQYDVSGSTTDTEYTNDSDSVTKSLTAFQDANTKLASMKAVKVGDGQKLYTTYEAKVKAFTSYATDLLASLKSYRPVAKACDEVSTTTLLSQCVTALNNVGDIPNADLKQYVATLKTQYKAYLDVATKIAAISDPYGDQYDTYKALRDQGYDIQDKISSASSDFSSNISKHADDIDPSSAANALGDFLVKKSNG